MPHAIILNDSMPADCLTKVVRYNHEILYHKSQSGPQVAPKVTLRPTFAKDFTAISRDTTASGMSQSASGARSSWQNFKLGSRDLMRILGKLVPCMDEQYRGVLQEEIENDENRKTWISHIVRSILIHPDKDNLVEDLQSRCNESTCSSARKRRKL